MEPKRTYYTNGQVKSEEWRNEAGRYHRLDGPAFRRWYDNGQLGVEVWYINGVYHRLDGPVYRLWGNNGQLRRELWYINGVEYENEAEFQVAVDLYKATEIAELF